MQVRMQNVEPLTEQQIGEFLRGSEAFNYGGPIDAFRVRFTGESKAEVYLPVQQTLVGQGYFRRRKKQRGAIRSYLSKLTGLSLPQMTRLIRQQKPDGKIRVVQPTRRRFPVKYTEAGVALPPEVDRAHERLNGAATRHIPMRE
jgi:hypothetical protein